MDLMPYATYVGGKRTQCPSADEGPAQRGVLVNIDPKAYAAKPDHSSGETGRVSNRLMSQAPSVVGAGELAGAISSGRAFLPSVHAGKRSPETWAAQQLFCIDVDNDAKTLKRCGHLLPIDGGVMRSQLLGLPLLISYWSFSASEGNDRYRLLFSLDEPTQDKARAVEFGAALLAAYPEADQSSTQLNRLFFGTNKEVQLWR